MERMYIKGQAAENLRTYKYSGSDNSLTYKYFLSPLAQLGVDFVPVWVAPNVLTYLGHLCTLVVYFLPMWECGWGLDCHISRWTGIICSLFYFGWMQLDNMDGKQARKTNTSSALGLMFDHQVDALMVTIASTYMAQLCCFGSSLETVFVWFIGSCAFFFATWEELCLGVMDFPAINGPADGCLLLGMISLLVSLGGPENYSSYKLGEYTLKNLSFTFFVVCSVISGVFNFLRVVFTSKHSVKSVYWTSGFFYYILTMYMIVSFSPAQIHIANTRELLIAFGFCFAHEIAMIQLSHVTASDYTPIGRVSRVVLGSLIGHTLLHYYGLGWVPEGLVLQGLALVSGLSYFWMAYFVANEIAEELKISVFTIPYDKAK